MASFSLFSNNNNKRTLKGLYSFNFLLSDKNRIPSAMKISFSHKDLELPLRTAFVLL